MDYVLTFEKLVSEYEKISSMKYDDNLKIGPQNLKQHIMREDHLSRVKGKAATLRTKQPNMVSREHIAVFERAGSDLARKHQGIPRTGSNGVG